MVRRSSSPGCPSSGQAVGARCPLAVGAGVQVWGPGTVPLVCLPCGVLHATGVAGGCPGGRVSLAIVRGVWCQALSPSQLLILGAGSRAPLPIFAGHGWCGSGDPAPAPQRALWRAGVSPCGGGRTASRGVPRAIVRGVWGQALFLPLLLVLRAGSRGPLPTCYARGCAGLGTRHGPFGVRALWGAACRGGGGR